MNREAVETRVTELSEQLAQVQAEIQRLREMLDHALGRYHAINAAITENQQWLQVIANSNPEGEQDG